jgi:hypothetical protein
MTTKEALSQSDVKIIDVRKAINGGGWMNVQFELSQLQSL